MYLPPNVTSLIQTMDQGPISAMKKYYKTEFLRELLAQNCKDKSCEIAFVKNGHSWIVFMFYMKRGIDLVRMHSQTTERKSFPRSRVL